VQYPTGLVLRVVKVRHKKVQIISPKSFSKSATESESHYFSPNVVSYALACRLYFTFQLQ